MSDRKGFRNPFWIGVALVILAGTVCLLPLLTTPGGNSARYSSVPRAAETGRESGQMAIGTEGPGGVDVNRAGAGELTALHGIGPVMAERIIEEREKNGPFFYPEDLLAVRGIGEAKLGGMKDQIRIQTDGGQ